jgi:hypothetical protein
MYHATYWGSGSISPHIPSLGSRWKLVVSFTPRPPNSRGKRSRYLLDRRLCQSHVWSGRGGERTFPAFAGKRTSVVQLVAYWLGYPSGEPASSPQHVSSQKSSNGLRWYQDLREHAKFWFASAQYTSPSLSTLSITTRRKEVITVKVKVKSLPLPYRRGLDSSQVYFYL